MQIRGLNAYSVKSNIRLLERIKNINIVIFFDNEDEKSLLKLFRGMFRSRSSILNRIVSLSIEDINFCSTSAARFPKYLKYIKNMRYLTFQSKSYASTYYKTFLPTLFVLIFEAGFERKTKVSLHMKSFYFISLTDPSREHYVLAQIMTSFADARTFYSFDRTSVYRYHFTFCELVSRQRSEFRYLIGSSYEDVPKEYRDFYKSVARNIGSFHLQKK